MKRYSSIISLTKNSRGVYSIDPSLGCASGTRQGERGCYNDCYAARIAKLYGYDFSQTVYRNFTSLSHLERIRRQFNKAKLPFVRMGTMGDPSEDWAHTLDICEKLQAPGQLSLFGMEVKEIVIITKHWTALNDAQLERLKRLKVCVNTSVSALDSALVLAYRIEQYEKLKSYCRSILRITSFDFNQDNEQGKELYEIQKQIFDKHPVIDTVFRSTLKNSLVVDGVINIHKTKFLGKTSYMSKANKKTFIGRCENCLEMCGVNM